MLTNDLIRKIRHIEIRTKRLVNDSFAGEYHSVFKGRGMEFEEVLEYQPGDSAKCGIHVRDAKGAPVRAEAK